MLGNITQKYHDQLYVLFRIVVGLLFFQHGAQKILGMFGGINGGTVELMSLYGLAGIIELVGGLMIAFGLFTRLAALLGALDMLGALVISHLPKGLVPIENGGELALLYLVSFLLVLGHGSHKWSLDQAILKKEIF